MSQRSKGSDEQNKGFGIREKLADHKPGIDMGSQEREPESSGNHRFRRSEQKDIPKESLAARIAKSTKGG